MKVSANIVFCIMFSAAAASFDTRAGGPLSAGESTHRPVGSAAALTLAQQAMLPFEEIKFHAEAMENQVALRWSMSSQKNTDYFIVERSNDGLNWSPVEKQKAAENCRIAMYYEAVDNHAPEELSFYRLKIINLDGTEWNSDYAAVQPESKKEYLLMVPNNAVTVLSIVYSGDIKNVTYHITDKAGNKVDFPVLGTKDDQIVFDVSKVPAGEYNALLKSSSGKEVNEPIWINGWRKMPARHKKWHKQKLRRVKAELGK